MPYLKSVEESNKKREEYEEKRKHTYSNKKSWIYKNIYNTTSWRKLRKSYLSEHPLCEICLKNGKSVMAENVHHKKEISSGEDEEEMKRLGFDYNNLQSLCRACHKAIHDKDNNDKYFLFEEDE